MPKNGDFAYTGNGTEVWVPDTKINPNHGKESWFAVPLRGHGFTMGVYDSSTDRFVGYVVVEDLGVQSVKEWMKRAEEDPRMTKPISKFM